MSLFWVDISSGTVMCADLDSSSLQIWSIPPAPSAVIPAGDDQLLVPSGQKIFRLNPKTGEIEPFLEIAREAPSNRCNDAKCDSAGNLWLGTMDTEERRRSGRLLTVGVDGSITVALTQMGIPNSLAWDVQRGRFYIADSADGEIYVFDYDPIDGAISNKRVFLRSGAVPGIPDGSAIDSEGYLWNARWDGACVVRISPDGNVDRVVEAPCKRPTSCAFGGKDLATLFVTSAADPQAFSGSEAGSAGAVFCIPVDVPGTAIPAYGG